MGSPVLTNVLLLALLAWGIWHAAIVRFIHKTRRALRRLRAAVWDKLRYQIQTRRAQRRDRRLP